MLSAVGRSGFSHRWGPPLIENAQSAEKSADRSLTGANVVGLNTEIRTPAWCHRVLCAYSAYCLEGKEKNSYGIYT